MIIFKRGINPKKSINIGISRATDNPSKKYLMNLPDGHYLLYSSEVLSYCPVFLFLEKKGEYWIYSVTWSLDLLTASEKYGDEQNKFPTFWVNIGRLISRIEPHEKINLKKDSK